MSGPLSTAFIRTEDDHCKLVSLTKTQYKEIPRRWDSSHLIPAGILGRPIFTTIDNSTRLDESIPVYRLIRAMRNSCMRLVEIALLYLNSS